MSRMKLLSASQVNGFRTCPLRWHYRYRERAPEESRSGALVVGSVVHAALAMGIHELRSGETRLEELSPGLLFEKAWDAEIDTVNVPITWGSKGEEAAKTTAEGLVSAFLNAEDLRERVARIVDLDVKFEIPVVDPTTDREVPDLRLVGFLDGIERREDGKLVVWEAKTAASRAGYDESSLAVHLQAGLYAHALQYLHGDDASEDVHFRLGLKLKDPVWEDRLVTFGASARKRVLMTVLEVKRAMDSGVAYPSPGWACSGCAYSKRCSGWQHQMVVRPSVDVFAFEAGSTSAA